ncbi:MAG TPA: glycosyltransferase family 2 protein [Steroidobacteraceae bacterium]|jgi:cellulose synthase/poly-beta-1,6-N-acetylglucosamine synthase-like glycosyltransferase
MTLTLLVIAAACLLLAMHPFVTYPLSLLLMKRFRKAPPTTPAGNEAPLRFAICMCAYNEERVIGQKVQNLLQLRVREPGLQIHIYVDAATDRTTQILQEHAHELNLHISPERHGKTYGMNLLAAQASADVLVFTDANVMLDLECLADLRRHFADPQIGCVCGNLNYTNGSASVTASTGSLYWRFEEAIKRLEADTGSTMGADGSIFAVRRALRHVPPDHIIDDMYVSLMVLVDGYRVIQTSDVRAYEESVTHSGEEFSRKVRIACQAFNVHKLIWPQLRKLDLVTRYKYVSHKLLRWVSIYFLAGAAIAFTLALLSAGYTLIALVLVVMALGAGALGWYWSLKPFAQIMDVLTALAGAGLGVWRSIRGERFQTWTPANSIRGGG